MYFKKKQSWWARLRFTDAIVLAVMALVIIGSVIFLFNKLAAADKTYTCLIFFPVLLGLVLELWRVTRRWKTVGIVTLVAYLLSLFAFIERKNVPYNLQHHLNAWMAVFILLFTVSSLFAVSFQENRPRITEGFIFLLTIAVNYWIIANGHWFAGAVFIKILIVITWIATIFVCYHAFTYRSLSKGNRLLLSIWGCIIALVLAFDNGYHLYNQSQTDTAIFSEEGWLLFVQYFLLGMSAIYIMENIALTAAYLIPGNHIPVAGDAHLKRISGEQVYVGDSIVISMVCIAVFAGNYFFNWLPVNTVIWVNIVLLPICLSFFHRRT